MPGSAASASTLPPPALAAGLFFRALLPSSAKEGEGKLKQKQTNKKHKTKENNRKKKKQNSALL